MGFENCTLKILDFENVRALKVLVWKFCYLKKFLDFENLDFEIFVFRKYLGFENFVFWKFMTLNNLDFWESDTIHRLPILTILHTSQ